ncbi:MAG: hypothetical protein KDA48_14110 [Amphiplicatus sp.]|nr:hypothetical protein [Amphiplicatus sp.]
MPRTNDEVIDTLREIYAEEFGGRTGARFLIAWSDLRALYGFSRLEYSRFDRLVETGFERGVYIFDLGVSEQGHNVAIVRHRTVDRWRKVPRTIIRNHLPPADDDADDFAGDED